MNLEHERIFFRGIKIGGLNDPTFDFALVFRGLVPDFLDVAGLPLFEEFLI
jgi:hypothetical protein